MRALTVLLGMVSCLTCVTVGGTASAHAEIISLAADLSGVTQVPPNPSKGTGSVSATLDTRTRMLTWKGRYSGLTGQPLAAHFHGPADAKKNAPVVVNFDTLASPFDGTATLTEAQATDLLAGRWYVNIHTPSYPGGELRGQMQRIKD